MGQTYQLNVTKICLHSFITGLRPFLPILFVFLKELNYSYLQIGTLFSVMAFCSLALEIPAGTIADRFGAKYCLIISTIMLGSAFLMVGLVENYYLMVGVFALWGSSKSFYSGSDTTLIIESLKEANKLHKTSKYLSKKWASFYYGLAGGGLLCPLFLTYLEAKYAFFFTATLYYLSLLILFSIKQPPLDKDNEHSIHHIKTPLEYFHFIKKGVDYLLRHRTVKYLLLFTVMFSICSMIFFQYVQITLQEAGIPKEHFGYYYAFFTAIAAISSQRAHLMDSSLGEKKTIYLLLFLTIFALFGPLAFSLTIATLVPILIMQVQAGIHIPVMSNYLNRHIDSHHRATLNSIKSFIGGILLATCSPAVGYLADLHGFQVGLFALGVFLFIVAIGPSLKISERISRTPTNKIEA